MPNPWEKYAEEEPEGPWSKYKEAPVPGTAVDTLTEAPPPGVMERFRTSSFGRGLLGPTDAEREAVESGAMAGAPGGQPGLLPIAEKMLEFTSMPKPLREPVRTVSRAIQSVNPVMIAANAIGGDRFKGMYRGLEDLIIGMPVAPLPGGVAGKVAMGTFAAQYATGVPELLRQREAAVQRGDKEEKGRIEAMLAGGAAMNVALPALHIAAGRVAKPSAAPAKPPLPEVRIPGTPTEVPSDIPSRTFEVEGKSVKVLRVEGNKAIVEMPNGETQEFLASSLKETTPGTGSARQSELPGLSEEHQALIKEGAQSNAASGLGSKVRLVEEITDTGDPFAKSDNRAIATIDADGNIVVNRPLFQEWTSEIPKWRQKGAVRSLFSEEGFHHIIKQVVSSEAVKELWDNGLTRLERYLGEKSYRGDDKTTPLDSYQLGHEYLRRVAQWADKAGVREVKEASNIPDWLTEEGIDLTLRGIHQARKLLAKAPKLGEIGGIGEKLKTESADTISRMMDRVQSNLESIKANTKHWEKQNAAKGEKLAALDKGDDLPAGMPEALRQRILAKRAAAAAGGGQPAPFVPRPGFEAPRPPAVDRSPVKGPDDALTQAKELLERNPSEPLRMSSEKAYDWGYELLKSPEKIQELRDLAVKARAESKAAFANKELPFDQRNNAVMKAQYITEALEVAERADKPRVQGYIKGREPALAARSKEKILKDAVEEVVEETSGTTGESKGFRVRGYPALYKTRAEALEKSVESEIRSEEVRGKLDQYLESLIKRQPEPDTHKAARLIAEEMALTREGRKALDEMGLTSETIPEWEVVEQKAETAKTETAEGRKALQDMGFIRKDDSPLAALDKKGEEQVKEDARNQDREKPLRALSKEKGSEVDDALDQLSKMRTLPFGEKNLGMGTRDAFALGYRFKESPERIPELQKMETEATAEKKKAMSDPSLSMEQKMHFVTKSQFVSEALQVAERKTEWPHVKRYIDEQEGGERLVAARRKKGDEKDQELLSFLPPIPGEKPERPTAEQAGAYIPEPPSLNKLAEQTVQFVGESAAKGKPSFKSFQKEMVRQYGKQVEPMLGSAWEDAVWKSVMRMPANDLARLNDRLTNMSEKEVEAAARFRAQRPGAIAEPAPTGPRPFAVEGEVAKEAKPQAAAERTATTTAQKRRATLMADTAQRLIRQAAPRETILGRETITPDDVGWQQKRAGASWREIDEGELRSRDQLKTSLTTGSRISGEPESVTRRLVAVRDNLTGEVYHLSAYKAGEGIHMIVDPQKSGQRPNTTLDSLLNQRTPKGRRRYTPMASVLLQDPVQNFRQRFESEAQWRAEFADEASSRAESYAAGQAEAVGKFEEAPEGREAPPWGTEFQPEEIATPRPLTPATSRELTEGAGVLRSGRELTRSEVVSLMDYIHEEVQQIESRQDMTDSLGSLKYKADHGKLQAADFRVISALEKMVNHVERTSDLKGDAAVEKVLDTIYDNAKTSKTYDEELVQRTLGEFTPPAPKPVQPVPSPTARELTALSRLPPTVTRGEKLPAGTGPKPELAGEPALQAILKPAGKDLLEWARGMVVKPVQWYSEWMVDRMRRLGGPILKATTDTFNQIISRERELYGSLTPSLDPARTAAGNMGKATTWLHKITPITSRTGVANTVGAIESTAPVPAFAQRVVDLARTANLQIGNLIAPVVRGFIATGKFQRNLTGFGFDIVRQGKGRVWDDWTAGLAAANRAPVGAVRSFFRKWKAVLDEPGQDAAILERVNQDFARKFPKVVTHVKTGELGLKWEEVVHANLFNYLETAARRATHARSFREAFPQTATGRQMFRNMQQAARKELAGEYQQDFDALLRTLQGHPSDTYGGNHPLSPGQPLGETFRFLNQTVGTVMARMVLSGQMFRQPGENIAGSTPVFLGYRNYLRGMARVKQLYPELEKQGAVNRVMYDWSFDPASRVRSASRIVANTFTKGFMENFLNELQEAGAAATARVVRERIDAGTLSGWEKRQLPQTLQAMGFTKAQAASMMVRGREPELLTQFERKAASFLTSGNRAIAEGSQVGANRLFNSLFRFQSYPMMKMNQFRQVTGKMLDAWNTGTTQEKVASTEQFARFAFGNTLQGAWTVGIAALAYEGLAGVKIMVNEAKDDPLRFLVESLLSSLSGPLYLLWRGSKSKGLPGISEQAGRAFFPYSITKDMVDAAQGAGQYRDLDGFEKVGKFLSQKIPGTRAIALGMSAVGLSQQNIKLDAAIKGFYRWRRDTMGASESNDWLKDDERREFRKAMKNAVEALKTGKIEAYYEALAQANGTPTATKNSVSSSLKARIILKGPGQGGKPLDLDQLEALRSHIGTEAMDRLQYFDLMLQRAAEGTLIPPME